MGAEREDWNPAGDIAAAQREGVWGTYTVHLRDGVITHTSLRKTYHPSAQPLLSSLVQQHPEARDALASGEDRELIYARFKNKRLTLVAVENHRIRTPNNGEKEQEKP